MVGAGAVITRDVPPHAIVVGNPGRISGYCESSHGEAATDATSIQEGARQALQVTGAAVHTLRRYEDMRGALSVAEFSRDMPFIPKRCFVVHDVPSQDVRGEHAHRKCSQFLICVSGSLEVVVDNGRSVRQLHLAGPEMGLYIPPMVWSTQYNYSPGAVLLVFASEEYDPGDYIRDYSEFLGAARERT